MTPRLAFAAGVLILAGCDRFEESGGVLPPPVTVPTAPAVSVQDVYVKGTSTLALGQSVEFRTEAVDGAVLYRWTAQGTGGVAFAASSADAGLGRVVMVGGTTVGPVTVEATALDAQRRVIARGTRGVAVR